MTEGAPRKKRSTSTARAGSRKESERLARAEPPTAAEAPPSDTPAAHPSVGDRVDRVRVRAYLLYVKSGYQHGHDLEHWLEAERQLDEPDADGRKKSDPS